MVRTALVVTVKKVVRLLANADTVTRLRITTARHPINGGEGYVGFASLSLAPIQLATAPLWMPPF